MAARGEGLGRVFNVIYSASGLDIPLTKATAVSFVSFLDAGTQALTFTQTDSTGVNSEADLEIFTFGGTTAPATESRIHKGPAVGGTWTEAAATADSVFTNADATNDVVVVTVRAEQLSDGYDRVQCTAATGTCVAIVHDLLVERNPGNLQSSLTV
jgi:hypothetical protein